MADAAIVTAAASRPFPGEPRNGDAWAVHWHGEVCRVALIDGLGHGPAAAAAAAAARAVLAEHPDLGPLDVLAACHTALAGTRGAAMAVACIDPLAGRVEYAGVGNIEARLLCGGCQQRPISYRGIVGSVLPRLQAFTFRVSGAWLLVLHTDGLRSRMTLEPVAADPAVPLQPLAEALLRAWARPTDDATIVLVRPRACGSS